MQEQYSSLKKPNIGLVTIKKVINPYAKIKIKPDGSGVETQNMPFIANPYDEATIIEAVKLKEQGFLQSLIVTSVGEDCKDILMQALAKGADRAVFIKTSPAQTNLLSPLKIAKILKTIVINNNVNLVFLGKQSSDYEHNQTGPMLAGLLDWPQGCMVSKIYANHSPNINMTVVITVEREIDNGIETLDLELPAVITLELPNDNNKESTSTNYISVAKLMQAKKKPFDTILLENLLANTNDLTTFLEGINQNYINVINTKMIPQNTTGIKLNNSLELANVLKKIQQSEQKTK